MFILCFLIFIYLSLGFYTPLTPPLIGGRVVFRLCVLHTPKSPLSRGDLHLPIKNGGRFFFEKSGGCSIVFSHFYLSVL